MKKILIAMIAFVFTMGTAVGVTGCGEKNENKNAIYYGVLKTIGDDSELYVYIPEIGDCYFPKFENEEQIIIKGGHLYNRSLKEGDLVSLEFAAENVQFSETLPVRIVTPVHVVWLYKENIKLEKDGEYYFLSIGLEEHEKLFFDDSLKTEIGETIELVKAQFITGEGTGSGSSGFATIVDIDVAQVTLKLYLQESIERFLKHFASGAIAFAEPGEFWRRECPLSSLVLKTAGIL